MNFRFVLLRAFLLLPLIGCSLSPPPRSSGAEAPPDPSAVARGAYLAAAANCVGCHTAKSPTAMRFAGGAAVDTPFGTFNSRNITPDPVHGIGAWTDADFVRALREGIAPGGAHYFSAFPFPAFTGMTGRDILDIHAFLRTQPPAPAENRPSNVAFPFDMRIGMVFWRMLYFKEGPFVPDPRQSAEWNRGVYLTTAVVHCQECHTPRTKLGGLELKRSFAGGTLYGPGVKHVPNITSDPKDGISSWTRDDIADFLKTGARPFEDAVGAPMSEVITGTAKLSDADRLAIATYIKSLPALPAEGE